VTRKSGRNTEGGTELTGANFGAHSGPEIPECSALRIYSRIPKSLLVIRPVIAPARLDRACFELWQDELFRTKQQKAWPDPVG